jgi:GTP pyrophosphokinase
MATAATAAAIPAGCRPYRRARTRFGPPRPRGFRLRASAAAAAAAASPSTSAPVQGGGRLVAELVGAFNELTRRMGEDLATSSSSRLLFRALKLALPALRGSDGGRALARALVVAASLADLQVTRVPTDNNLRMEGAFLNVLLLILLFLASSFHFNAPLMLL